MKKILFGCSLLILLYSCINENGNKIKKKTESKQSEIVEHFKVDTIEKIRIDSLARIAWGDLIFGMSLKEAEKTKTFNNAYRVYKDQNTFQKYSLIDDEARIEGISRTEASFFNDRLYRIDLESHKETANYYDTDIKEIVFRLKKLIENKYGKPNMNYGFPSFFEMRADQSVTAYGWQIGDKYMYINVREVYGGSEYKVECGIFHNIEINPVKEFDRKQKEQEESKQKNKF